MVFHPGSAGFYRAASTTVPTSHSPWGPKFGFRKIIRIFGLAKSDRHSSPVTTHPLQVEASTRGSRFGQGSSMAVDFIFHRFVTVSVSDALSTTIDRLRNRSANHFTTLLAASRNQPSASSCWSRCPLTCSDCFSYILRFFVIVTIFSEECQVLPFFPAVLPRR